MFICTNHLNITLVILVVKVQPVTASLASGSYNSVDFQNSVVQQQIQHHPYNHRLINGSRYNLFKVNTRSHGSDVNDKLKVVLSQDQERGTIDSDYGSFSLQVRQTGLNDKGLTTDNILEQYDNLNFNQSTNYFARRIGDRYVTIDSDGKLTYNGDWDNRSKHIYVSDFSEIANGSYTKSIGSNGTRKITNPSGGTTNPSFQRFSVELQWKSDVNVLYMVMITLTVFSILITITKLHRGNHTTMSLEDFNGQRLNHPQKHSLTGSEKVTLDLSHIDQRRFVVPFQGGYDGDNKNPKLDGHC